MTKNYKLFDKYLLFTYTNRSVIKKDIIEKIFDTLFPNLCINLNINDYISNYTSKRLNHLKRIIIKNNIKFIVGDPIYLSILAQKMLNNKSDITNIKGIISMNSILTNSCRKKIQKAFNCKVYNHYGCSEVPDIANECEYNNLHINPNSVYVEFLNDGRLINKGQIKKIILTNLDNYIMPLINYNIGDIGTLLNTKCKCGRNSLLIKSVEGRIEDLIVLGKREFITPSNLDKCFFGLNGILLYQVIQIDKKQIVIKIVKNRMCNPKTIDEIKKNIKVIFKKDIKVEFRFVKKISKEKSNKIKLIKVK